jgi:hypothetical protein
MPKFEHQLREKFDEGFMEKIQSMDFNMKGDLSKARVVKRRER